MSTQTQTSSATAATTGWTSFFDLDLHHFRGSGKTTVRAFARDLHSAVPSAPEDDEKRRRLVDSARSVEQDPKGSDYALVALADGLPALLNAMRGWPSREVAHVFRALRERWTQMCNEQRYNLRLEGVVGWVEAHENDPDRAEAVASCIKVDAPVEVAITKRLSKSGSQKVVFEAKWTVADDPTEIVLKQLQEGMQDIFERELRPHPLSMRHPNIIETYWLANQARSPEVFLVERRLRPLRDSDNLSGESDGGRLFVDLMRALAFLEGQGLVHGDIKPDNIAYSEGRFILLDFGICRPAPEFRLPEATATGSLRTRAPELLLGEDHSAASDVWAAAATVFNILLGRFPLWRVSDPALPTLQHDHGERAQAEERMRGRVRKDYAKNLAGLEKVRNRSLRTLLEASLARRPTDRPSAGDLLASGLKELPSLIGNQDGPLFEAENELTAMKNYLSREEAELSLMSERERDELLDRLDVLRRALNAERHYQRGAKRLDRTIRQSLLKNPAAGDEGLIAREASSRACSYVSRADRAIDQVWDELRRRVESAPVVTETLDTPSFEPQATDLVRTLHELAASAVGRRQKVAEALHEFEALVDQTA